MCLERVQRANINVTTASLLLAPTVVKMSSGDDGQRLIAAQFAGIGYTLSIIISNSRQQMLLFFTVKPRRLVMSRGRKRNGYTALRLASRRDGAIFAQSGAGDHGILRNAMISRDRSSAWRPTFPPVTPDDARLL